MKKLFVVTIIAAMFAQPVLADQNQVSAPKRVQSVVSKIFRESQDQREVLLQAHEDASVYTFTDGAVRGEDFARAIYLIHRERPSLVATDMDIAIAILQAD